MKFPKHKYIRSTLLMREYRTLPCQHCGRDDGSVAGAHSNWGGGRGRAIKADDNLCASLCHACHTMLDQGHTLSKQERIDLWTAAHKKTVAELVRRGLWPKNVPIPDIG